MMLKSMLPVLLFLIAIPACVVLLNVDRLRADEIIRIGGNCTYQAISGSAEIMKIETAPEGENNCLDAVALVFNFSPDSAKAINEYRFMNTPDTRRRIFVGDGKNPPRSWALEMGLTPKSVHRCIRAEILKGTCAPVIFLFPDIDLSTYEKDCF